MTRYILTGAPGAGKTTLLHCLEARGYSVVAEAATDIIALEQAQGMPEPWTDPGFIEQIVGLQKERQIQAADTPSAWQFFDRSPLDTVALSLFLGYPIPPALAEEIERMEREKLYARQVFFIENLGFCEPSAARRITFEETLRFEAVHADVYTRHGYELIRIGAKPVEERADEIVRICAARKAAAGLGLL